MKNKSKTEFPNVFPEVIQNYIITAATSINCNADFASAAVLVAAASIIGNSARIRVKLSWEEVGILFLFIVGEPGSKKTPAIIKAISPLISLQKEFGTIQKMEEGLLQENNPFKAIMTSDATVEALYEVLYHNPRGILMYKDEAISFVKSMNQYKKGGDDMERYLSIWSGTPVRINRKGKPPIQINQPFLCVLGGIQVDVLRELGEMAKVNNGFFDRLLFVFPEPILAKHSEESIPEELSQQYENIFRFIYEKYQSENPLLLGFSAEAAVLWKKWNIAFCNYKNGPDLAPNMVGMLTKIETYIVRFSLIIEILNCAAENKVAEEITRESLHHAIYLGRYFFRNADKVIRSFTSSEVERSMQAVMTWLKRQKSQVVNLRAIYTAKVGGIKNKEQALDLIKEMRAQGMIFLHVSQDTDTRISYQIQLNPKYKNNNHEK